MTETEKKRLKVQLVKLLRPETVDEAHTILTNCDSKWLISFKQEMKKMSGNTACCVIDFGKIQLVRDGKMKKGGHFGNGGYGLSKEDIAKL